MPFRFLEEIAIADVAFEAWGATLAELFTAAADALLRTMTAAPERVERQQELTISLENDELDLLLFAFLQELIFYKDARRLLLHAERVAIRESRGAFRLEAVVSGEPIAVDRHRLLVDVKAVTLHRFRLEQTGNRWQATVVLDV